MSAVEWWIVWPSWNCQWCPTTVAKLRSTRERFVNARAEDYGTLRELFEQGEIDIDPDDDKLAAQLGSIKWTVDSRGRIKIESKDDTRKRGLPSPDRADAMAIAFAGGANAAPVNIESHAGKSITGGSDDKAVVGASLPARLATQGVGRLRTGSRDRGFVPQPSHVGERARRWRR